MTDILDRKFKEYIQKNSGEWLLKTTAKLGKTDDGPVETGTAGLLYARLDNGQIETVWNIIAPSIPGTFVQLGISKEMPGIWQVISVRETYVNPSSGYIASHAPQHSLSGFDPTWLDWKQVTQLTVLVHVSVDFTVRVYSSIISVKSGEVVTEVETDLPYKIIDLSSYVPTAGAVYIKIVAEEDGTITPIGGTPFAAPELGTDADIPAHDYNQYPLGVVLLYESQEALFNENIRKLTPVSTNYLLNSSAFADFLVGVERVQEAFEVLDGHTHPGGSFIEDAINDGEITKAPTENAVFDALAGKETAGAAITAEDNAKAYADGLVVGLWDDRGSFDASGGAYPSSGGSGTAGAILKGDIWTISVAGTLPTGQVVEIGDVVRALVNTPGNTQANWAITQNNIGYVAENSANKTSTITGNETSTVLYSTIKGIVDWVKQGLTGVLPSKTTPIDADSVLINDSADSNKTKLTTWANIKATLKTTIKLDEWDTPTDVTTLNASTSAHGLLIKATAPASGVRNVLAIDNAETVYKNTALVDSTNPADIGTTAPGTSLIAARRDHVHGGSYLNLSNRPTVETNANDIFRCDSPGGVSAFAGTIATLPGGATLTYNVTSGQELAMVPFSTSQLGKILLHNTTRGTHALISNCVAGTNTITLTANVPVGWALTDVITIASQTVSGGGRSWVDIEITSGLTGKSNTFFNLAINSATAGDNFWYHPFSVSYSDSKVKPVVVQAASRTLTVSFPVSIISNTFVLSWSGTPAVCIVREDGYLE